jgi:hypothetical protein
MRREIALLTLGACLGVIGLSDYGISYAKPSSAVETVLEVIAQTSSSTLTKPWYNCTAFSGWSPGKQSWCQKTEKLKNTRYELPHFATFQLENGVYEHSSKKLRVALVNKSGAIAFGDLNRDGKEDAATLLTVNAGGDGTFVYLSTVENVGENPQNQTSLLLGDRVEVQSITINRARVRVDMVTHAPDDPLCCPTQPTTQLYALSGNHLQPLAKPTARNPRFYTSLAPAGSCS